jgi:hypothetical protein
MTSIDRPLNDDERSLLLRLAIATLAEQTGSNEQTAADALDHFTEEGKAIIRGDGEDVYLEVAGNVLVHARRDWLAFHASFPGHDPMADGHRLT